LQKNDFGGRGNSLLPLPIELTRPQNENILTNLGKMSNAIFGLFLTRMLRILNFPSSFVSAGKTVFHFELHGENLMAFSAVVQREATSAVSPFPLTSLTVRDKSFIIQCDFASWTNIHFSPFRGFVKELFLSQGGNRSPRTIPAPTIALTAP